MADDKYYRLLGISKDASDDEIKKAYKKAALRHHPDRNPNDPETASKKFKEVSEAFDVLSDSNKRHLYDTYGEDGLKNQPPPGSGFGGGGAGFSGGFPGGGGGGGGMEDILNMFMNGGGRGGGMGGMGGMGGHDHSPFGDMGGGFGGMPGGGGGRRQPRAEPKPKPDEIVRPLPCSLEDLFTGTTKKLKITRRMLNGTLEEKVVSIVIKPGWKTGTRIKYESMGTEVDNGPSADVVFVVEEKPHDRYKRQDNDLILNQEISLLDALTSPGGSQRTITLLDGTTTLITVPPSVVTPGKETRLFEMGMPISKKGSLKKKGDLLVRWQIKFPLTLTDAQKEGLKKVLG
ncbi:Molecular chaperone (DnaJ superfamily) [Phaffia rhodozyma]|uniref:Molecular chaperone (DnaJ superfamily) n=1 Tax=Phaffia rhodozyma TaxID=264483 RepID=A0A0F7SNK9_PHARH|nr:Molecular chaperone (DnaJ superfamily) [Phaffia rhodozyma]